MEILISIHGLWFHLSHFNSAVIGFNSGSSDVEEVKADHNPETEDLGEILEEEDDDAVEPDPQRDQIATLIRETVDRKVIKLSDRPQQSQ